MRRVDAPFGGSILTTSAPSPARTRPQYSPSSSAVSTTRMPSSIPGFKGVSLFGTVSCGSLFDEADLRHGTDGRILGIGDFDVPTDPVALRLLADEIADDDRAFLKLDGDGIVGRRKIFEILPVKHHPGQDLALAGNRLPG